MSENSLRETCRYRYSNGTECNAEIMPDSTSPSGYMHAMGRDWCHWASPKEYGPQDSEASFVKRVATAGAPAASGREDALFLKARLRQKLRELMFPKIVDDALITEWMWADIERFTEALSAMAAAPRPDPPAASGLPPDDWSPGDVIAAGHDGTIILDDGITTFNRIRAKDFLAGSQAGELRGRALAAAPRPELAPAEVESRSQLKRKAAMRGEPMPTFGAEREAPPDLAARESGTFAEHVANNLGAAEMLNGPAVDAIPVIESVIRQFSLQIYRWAIEAKERADLRAAQLKVQR